MVVEAHSEHSKPKQPQQIICRCHSIKISVELLKLSSNNCPIIYLFSNMLLFIVNLPPNKC